MFRSLSPHLSQGIEAVPTVGKPFDPAVHEAISRTPSSSVKEDTVSTEFRKGFRIGGRLIRPAMVAVSVPGEEPPPPAAAEAASEPAAQEAAGEEAAAPVAPADAPDKAD